MRPGFERPRILVSTDIGGTDPDDFQSMVHLLLYADVLDLEGLLSSPYGDGRVGDIHAVIDRYAVDHPNLLSHDPRYPEPDALRAIARQGSVTIADHAGQTGASEGSDWIITCARRPDPRPLDVLVWGGLDDVAQALHDAPDIVDRIRVHYIGGPNTLWGVNAYAYILRSFPQLRMIESNSTYRGFFEPGPNGTGPDNIAFVAEHVAGHGALGDFFAAQLPHLKMGDSPTVTWLLEGSRDPARPSWGGRFVPLWEGRGSVFGELPQGAEVEVNTVVEIRLDVPAGFTDDDHAQLMIDGRVQGPFSVGERTGGTLEFRFSIYHLREIALTVQSSHAALDGLTGSVITTLPTPEVASRPSAAHPHWWSDDPDPEKAIGHLAGARWVSDRRAEFLGDFAARLDRCQAPA
jgi:hypothetical protein